MAKLKDPMGLICYSMTNLVESQRDKDEERMAVGVKSVDVSGQRDSALQHSKS